MASFLVCLSKRAPSPGSSSTWAFLRSDRCSHSPVPSTTQWWRTGTNPGPGVHRACCHAVILMAVPNTAVCFTLSGTKMALEQELRRGLVKTQWSPLYLLYDISTHLSKLIKTGSNTEPEIATKQRCPPQTWNTLLIIQRHTYSYHKHTIDTCKYTFMFET